MKETKNMSAKPLQTLKTATPGKQEQIIRRTSNHNVHMITPHGNIQAGRKGRKG